MARSLVKFAAGIFLVACLFSCGDLTTELTSITISPPSATVGINQGLLFTATGKNSAGNLVKIDASWSVQGNIGTISSNGLFVAGAAVGSGSVLCSADSIDAEASVTVTDKGWIAGKVEDEQGHFVAGITVYLLNTTPSLQDITQSDGSYSIANVPAGTYHVFTNDPMGTYQPASQEAVVGSGQTVQVPFTIYYYSPPPTIFLPTI